MWQGLLNEHASSPATLKLLSQAFDEVWTDIAGNFGDADTIEGRRARLARIIVEIANIGERDLDEIKSDALAIMRLQESKSRR